MTLFDPIGTLYQLRGRQIPLIPAITQSVREGHKRIIVQFPTGAGKTVVAAHLMSRSAEKGRRPIFIAPAIALVEQTLASFERQGLSDIGIIQAQHHRTDWRAQIQIASRDTLVRRALPEVDFVIVDEVHDRRDSLDAILTGEAWANKIVIGLSATPWSRGMGLVWTKLIVGATIREMIQDGAPTGLCSYKLWGPKDAHEVNVSGIKTGISGEFDDAGAARAAMRDDIVGDVVDNWLRRRQAQEHPGDRTFLYGVTRAHAKSLMEAFQAKDVSCGYMDGLTPAEERLRTFQRYRTRQDKILCNVGVLITGVDEDVRVIIDAAPRKSEINWVQCFGRGLRLADGKDYLRFYDHGQNALRLGLPDDIHHEELDTRDPKAKSDPSEDDKPTPKPRKCKKCFAIIPPKTKACPSCGDVYQALNTIEHVPGELVEMSPTMERNLIKGKKPKKPAKDEKQVFYSGLIGIAHQRGFKEGWAANKYRTRFGVWPQGLQKIATRPSAEVLRFERESRTKYFAERKAAEQTTATATANATTAT